MDGRKAFAAIVSVLRTGIQWNALPRELGASSTVHDRFQAWERTGFFEELWGGARRIRRDEGYGVGAAGHRRGDGQGPLRQRRYRQEPHGSGRVGDET